MHFFFGRKKEVVVEKEVEQVEVENNKDEVEEVVECNKDVEMNVVKEEISVSSQLDDMKLEIQRLTDKVNELQEFQKFSNRTTEERANEVILYFDGTLYVGSVRSDQHGYFIPHGYGTICYPYGSRYIGEWRDGEFNGKGTYYPDYYSRPFTSDWVNHVPNGNATWDGVHYVKVKNGIFDL